MDSLGDTDLLSEADWEGLSDALGDADGELDAISGSGSCHTADVLVPTLT